MFYLLKFNSYSEVVTFRHELFQSTVYVVGVRPQPMLGGMCAPSTAVPEILPLLLIQPPWEVVVIAQVVEC